MTETSTKKLQGKVAIITGGASGIGEATAHLFAEQGARAVVIADIGEATAHLFAEQGARAVVIADIQDDAGRRVAEAIGSNRCSYVHCDVTDENEVEAAVEWTVKTYGQLDVMFSNAGIASRSDQVILDLDLCQFDHLFAVNVRGMAACVKHAALAMVEKRIRGSIICTASVTGSKGTNKWTDYTMSKHAVVGLVRAASRQLGEHGIRVNSVSPYAVATPLMQEAYKKEAEEVEKVFADLNPLKGTVLRVNNVADAVLFLASDESAFVSGHDLVIDGGYVC